MPLSQTIGTEPLPMRAGATLRWLTIGVGAAVLACFHKSLRSYAADNYYQSHFLFLWALFFLAVVRSRPGPVRLRFEPARARSLAGIALALAGALLLAASIATGSSTTQRLGLVAGFGAVALLCFTGWSVARALAYVLFAMLCFGVPYSIYSAVTIPFARAFLGPLEVAARLFGARVDVMQVVVSATDYRLEITPACSGFNQLVTFSGIAMLGSLTAKPMLLRTVMLMALGVALAFVTNFVRIVSLVAAAAYDWRVILENPTVHSLAGAVVFAPFVLLFVYVILRTHVPREATAVAPVPDRGWPVALLAVPFLAVPFAFGEPPLDTSFPAYMDGVGSPPGFRLDVTPPSVEQEKVLYDTPHLVHAVYAAEDGSAETFELFAYLTRSRDHLAVHSLANCLDVTGHGYRAGPPVDVGGRRFHSFELIRPDGTFHGYFAFWVDGEDRDDTMSSSITVFLRRIRGVAREVGLTRMIFAGPLPEPAAIPALEARLLEWRARQLAAAAGSR